MSRTKDRIRESNLRYRHSLGQHFIYDEKLLAELAADAGINSTEDVFEIGPGTGNLTKQLCQQAHHVLSLELDERLIPLLQAFMGDFQNFSLVQGDAMTADLVTLTQDLRKPFAVAANIPYYITTPLITRLLTSGLPVSRLALMIQKEVADKILSKPGQKGWGPLAIRCQYQCEPYLARIVPASSFTPAPKIDSAFIVMPVRKEPAVHVQDEKAFFQIVTAAFALRRKTMTNSLCASLHLDRGEAATLINAAGLNGTMRGEDLTMEQLGNLADIWAERKNGQ